MKRIHTIPVVLYRQNTITLVILTVMLLVVSILQKNFFALSSLQNTMISWTPLILLTLGQSIVMLSGGLDMSSGNAMSFLLCILAGTMKKDVPATGGLALGLCLLATVGIGLLNGLSVAYFKLPPLIATFATSYIYLGAALFILPSPGGQCVNWMRGFYKFSAVKGAPAALQAFGDVVPTGLLLILLACGIWLFVSRTKMGRYLYAVGSNREIAWNSGINTVKVQISAYLLNAVFVMLAALFLVGQNQSGSARIGDALTLKCIAASIIGGIALQGGSGNVFLSIAGAAIISLVSKFIAFSNINSDYQTLASGLILLLAVACAAILNTVQVRRKRKPAGEEV